MCNRMPATGSCPPKRQCHDSGQSIRCCAVASTQQTHQLEQLDLCGVNFERVLSCIVTSTVQVLGIVLLFQRRGTSGGATGAAIINLPPPVLLCCDRYRHKAGTTTHYINDTLVIIDTCVNHVMCSNVIV
jgi:hypothetical protein